jgi:hypothetical protein
MSANPILVVAPMPRCGSTLLQRLINSSRRAIIYGENFYLLDRVPDALADLHSNELAKRAQSDAVMQRLLAGHADIDGTALYPDHKAFLAAARDSFYHVVRHYDATSRRLGFARWGLKHQIRAVPGFRFLARLLPGARYVFIYRDVLPVARSMKARWPKEYAGAAMMRKIGFAWRNGLGEILARKGGDSLLLRYEDFVAEPAAGLAALEAFLELPGIDSEVLKLKVNSFAPAPDSPAMRSTYRAPAALTREEEAALLSGSAGMRRRLGYGPAPISRTTAAGSAVAFAHGGLPESPDAESSEP